MRQAILVFSAVLFNVFETVAASDQTPSVDTIVTIQQAILAHRDAIHSLEATYKVDAYEGPPGIHRGNIAHTENWKWLLRGRRMLFETTAHETSGAAVKHIVWSFDGAHSWQIAYDSGGIASKQVSVKMEGFTQPWGDAVTLADFMGWNVVGLQQSVLDLLGDKSDGEFKDVNGHQCFRVLLYRWSLQENGPPHVLVAWFDPAHGWLPRQIQIMPEAAWNMMENGGNPPDFVIGFQFHNFVVSEFKEFPIGAEKRSLWFPSKAMSNGGGMSELRFEVQNIATNIDLPISRFTPTVPVGSALFENLGTTKQRIIEPASFAASLEPTPDSMFSGAAPTISARVPEDSALRTFILTASVILIVVAGALKLRRLPFSRK